MLDPIDQADTQELLDKEPFEAFRIRMADGRAQRRRGVRLWDERG